MSPFAHITGWGMCVPSRVVTNAELAQKINSSDEWIRERTGIHQRHIAGPEDTSASLAAVAAERALSMANLSPKELELIVVATSTPEHIFPATACLVQDRIGATKAGAFDLLAACSGFIYALNMASQAIQSGSIRNAVVIGAETLSRITDWEDRSTCILFGDGAGAFVLQAGDEPAGIISAVMRSDGSGSETLTLPAGGSRLPASVETVQKRQHYIHMNGREVFRFATRVLVQATKEAVAKAKLTLDDIHLVIPHQANQRIIDAALRGLGVSMERCITNVAQYGNTSTASIPIAACEAVQQGRLHRGDWVVFVGFGAGLTWGAAVAKWSGPLLPQRRIYPASYRLWMRIRSNLRRWLRKLEGLIWGRKFPEI